MSQKILVMMTGSIAAYKACGVLSALRQKNYEIEVIMSPSCLKFIGAATVEGLTGKPPIVDMYDSGRVMDHIHLQRWADLILVAPATAHFINRMAVGIGDDLASTLFLAHDFQKPFLIAPAMNTKMYLHPTTQHSLEVLKKMGADVMESASGVLACGETGWGRLLDPKDIVTEIENRLNSKTNENDSSKLKFHKSPPQLTPRKKVLITAGGTTEPIDAVRVLSNTSTGQTGFFMAKILSQLGYDVNLLMSATHNVHELHTSDFDFSIQFFTTFQSLSDLLKVQLKSDNYDVLIHAAAVSDFHIDSKTSKKKLDSSKDHLIRLKRNPKLIDSLKKWSRNKDLQLFGFKLTSGATEKEIIQKVSKLFTSSHANFVIQNDTTKISNDPNRSTHIFRLYSPKMEYHEASGKEEIVSLINQQLQQTQTARTHSRKGAKS